MNDGGPAFPCEYRHHEYTDASHLLGMSLRDWFAGMALQVVHADGGRYGPEGMKQVAEYAYAMADAMIAERDMERHAMPLESREAAA